MDLESVSAHQWGGERERSHTANDQSSTPTKNFAQEPNLEIFSVHTNGGYEAISMPAKQANTACCMVKTGISPSHFRLRSNPPLHWVPTRVRPLPWGVFEALSGEPSGCLESGGMGDAEVVMCRVWREDLFAVRPTKNVCESKYVHAGNKWILYPSNLW